MTCLVVNVGPGSHCLVGYRDNCCLLSNLKLSFPLFVCLFLIKIVFSNITEMLNPYLLSLILLHVFKDIHSFKGVQSCDLSTYLIGRKWANFERMTKISTDLYRPTNIAPTTLLDRPPFRLILTFTDFFCTVFEILLWFS